jgi:hypothetical protein
MAATPSGFLHPAEKRPTAKLAEGVVRHAIVMPKRVRDDFVAFAKTHGIQQAQALEVLMRLADSSDVKVAELVKAVPNFTLYADSPKVMKAALKKVDPAALREFLEKQGAL